MIVAIIAPPGPFKYRYSMMAGIAEFIYSDHPEILQWAEENGISNEKFEYFRVLLPRVDTIVAFCDRVHERTNTRIALAILQGKRVEVIYI